MMPYRERNFYADHLVEINKINPVMTTQDVCNNLGAIVIPTGTNITEGIANKIAKFTLESPLELQVNLAKKISPNELFTDINQIQTQIFDSAKELSVTKELIRQCGLLSAFPLISQKLTVFQKRLPLNYSETQGVAGFAVSIALKLGMSDSSIEIIFASAQMHDVGFLNINPDVVENIEAFSEEERRVLYKTQLELGKQFLDQIPNLSKDVGASVLTHQERVDGSGWPEGIIGDQNSLESQVVGLAKMLHKAYSQSLKPRGFNRSHLIPILEVESESFANEVYHAAVEMLRQGAHKTAQVIPYEQMSSLASYLVVLQRIMIHWFELAKSYLADMNAVHKSEKEDRSLFFIMSLEKLHSNSGVWEESLRAWLVEAAETMELEECAEIELVTLMFESILQKLKCLLWSLRTKAKAVGNEWEERCDELTLLLYSLPNDHLAAFDRFECFDG